MKIIELILNEEEDHAGIEAVSVVESPAIEEHFIALKKHEVELKTIDEEKRILMGAALVPKKQIYRKSEKGEEFYIYFSKETIRKASQLFLKKSNQNNATLEHDSKIEGMTVVESWIVEDTKKDKSSLYNFNVPEGTWMISMKVDNDEVWSKVKSGDIKGFSIEGYFQEKIGLSTEKSNEKILEELKKLILEYEEEKKKEIGK